MSDEQPVEPTVPLERPGDVETVGPQTGSRGSRRATVVTAVAVAVAAVLGGGAYAAYSFLNGGGPQPADVLPASTVAVVSVDLDPSAGQKIAAIKSIRRFPALKKSLGLQADDDLREYVFDKLTAGSQCSQDFDKDVKPWLGKRAAFAGVDLGGSTPVPVIALQISDPAKARNGFDAIVRCAKPDDFAFVVGHDYLIASDSAAHARAVLAKGKQKPLADDAAYRKWTGEAGDAGVVSFYVAKSAAGYADKLLGQFSDGLAEGLLGDSSDGSGSSAGGGLGSNPFASAKEALKGFEGLGGTIRFSGGGMELSLAAGGLTKVSDSPSVGDEVGDLPGDTAVALGFGVGKDYAKGLVDQLGTEGDDLSHEAEDQAGLDLPGDLQTLLGTAVTLSLGGKAPASLDDLKGPEDLPVGLVIHGDADRIRAIIAKIEDHLGKSLADFSVNVDDSGGKVAIGPGDYAGDELLKHGSLGHQGSFTDAVPDADKAGAILYLDFDSKWRDLVVDAVTHEEGSSSGHELDENTRPLRSLGISSWLDGGVTHALVRLTTD
jgi:uncharacterized protein DUF3352